MYNYIVWYIINVCLSLLLDYRHRPRPSGTGRRSSTPSRWRGGSRAWSTCSTSRGRRGRPRGVPEDIWDPLLLCRSLIFSRTWSLGFETAIRSLLPDASEMSNLSKTRGDAARRGEQREAGRGEAMRGKAELNAGG